LWLAASSPLGVYKGYYATSVIAIIPLTLLIPWGMRWLADWLSVRHPDQQQGALLLVDACAAGIAISAAGYSLVPSLTFLGILLASAMAFGNLFLVTLAAFTSLTASLLGGLVFGFDMAPLRHNARRD
jgi:hypothetical protein